MGRQSLSPIGKAHGLCNSLYYRTSRDCASVLKALRLTIVFSERNFM